MNADTGSLQNSDTGMKAWLAVAMLAAACTGAACTGALAQSPDSEGEAKILRCRQSISELIWLNRESLRAKCGLWTSTYTVKSKKGEIERLVYSRYFTVTLRDGVVSSVRERRQVFTGFKKKS